VRKTPAIIGLLAAAVLLYGFLVEPSWLETHHLRVQDAALHRALAGRIAVQLTDLHLTADDRLAGKILERLRRLKPDIIFLTGDYVRWRGDYPAALSFLAMLDAPLGVWAVMGDYDYSDSRRSCLFCHRAGSGAPTRRHRVHFLRNASAVIHTDSGAVRIVGLDGNGEEERRNAEASLGAGVDGLPTIVLSHDPLAFDDVPADGRILMLSGDTHGGQVPLPGWFWRLIGYTKNAQYNQGLFRRGQNTLYVSRGVGTSHVPIRIGRRPELVVFYF